jgi:uncharacterized membrane protein
MTRSNRPALDNTNPNFQVPDVFRPANAGFSVSETLTQFSSGPIPDPERLAKYNEILPGAANRILTMAENQATHRQKMEWRVITADIIRAYAGVICGFLITVMAFVIGGYLIYLGHDWAGATIIITDLAVLVGVFIYGTQTRKQQLQAKREASDKLIRPKK